MLAAPRRRADRARVRGAVDRVRRHPGDRRTVRAGDALRRPALFLFSGTFFPISRAADAAQAVGLDLAAVARRRAVSRAPPPARRPTVARRGRSPTSSILLGLHRGRVRCGARAPSHGGWCHDDHRTPRRRADPPTSRMDAPGARRSMSPACGWSSATSWRGTGIWLRLPLGASLEPILFLLSIGIGVGELVGDVEGPGGTAVPYRDVRAPRPARGRRHDRPDLRHHVQLLREAASTSTSTTRCSPRRCGPRDVVAARCMWSLVRGRDLRHRVPRSRWRSSAWSSRGGRCSRCPPRC